MRWYDKDANVVEGATLREARANHYYPSVTSILDVIAKPGVEIWKQNILIDEAMKLNPIFAEHEADEFKEAVRFRANLRFDEAANLGIQYHSALVDTLLCGGNNHEVLPLVTLDAIRSRMKDLEIFINEYEKSFVNTIHGYAGTIDIIGHRVAGGEEIPIILDWKTQATNGKSPRYYDQWPMQLAGYNIHNSELNGRLFESWNCVISTSDPGKVWFKRWKNLDKWNDAFFNALYIWMVINNYDSFTGEKFLLE